VISTPNSEASSFYCTQPFIAEGEIYGERIIKGEATDLFGFE
jgi:hypothetical protein